MTDIAPDATTQADHEAAEEWRDILCHRNSEYPGDPVADLATDFARHRRPTPHSAGEGLREALDTVRVLICEATEPRERDPLLQRAVALIDRALTPPSDAGSTTRSGGEGNYGGYRHYVDAFYDVATLLGIGPRAASPADVWHKEMLPRLSHALATTPSPDSGEGDDADLFRKALHEIANARPIGGHCHSNSMCAVMEGIALRALATTLSPDASPDSGEAFNTIERVRNVVMEFIECARLRGDNELPHPCDDPKLWTARMIDAWGELEALADEDPLAALHLFPEAPAIVKEAGEVERLLHEGEWFYPEGDHSSDECRFSPDEVIDYALEGENVSRVVAIERAAALPTVYAAVRVYSDAEKDARGSDDEYDYTLFATSEEARAALSASNAAQVSK